jgi:16S rRNA (guanine527-N7)-methyltransferase
MTGSESRYLITPDRIELLDRYAGLLLETNARVNLIARTTDAADVPVRHLAHSLTLARRGFPAGCTVVDFGTGGGLPGLPLAIAFPDVRFVLLDSTRKKVDAVADMARTLGLDNVTTYWGRAEAWDGAAHYAVSRATAPLRDLWRWFWRARQPVEIGPDDWAPGLLALKGGDLSPELRSLPRTARAQLHDLFEMTGETAFREKVLVHVTPA